MKELPGMLRQVLHNIALEENPDRYDSTGKKKTDIFTQIKYSEIDAKKNQQRIEGERRMRELLEKANKCP